MDKIKKYKYQSIWLLIGFAAMGIAVYLDIMQQIRLGNPESVTLLLLAVWVMFYVEYGRLKTKIEILKTKIEILKEIRGEEHNKPN